MIIIRTLRKDIANYNKEDDIVRGLGCGGMGWKGEGSLVCVCVCALAHVSMRGCMGAVIQAVNLKSIEKSWPRPAWRGKK